MRTSRGVEAVHVASFEPDDFATSRRRSSDVLVGLRGRRTARCVNDVCSEFLDEECSRDRCTSVSYCTFSCPAVV